MTLRYWLGASVAFVFTLTVPLHAQSPDSPKFEAGLGYVLMHTGFLNEADQTKSGIATRLGYSLDKHFAVEAAFNILPQDIGNASRGMIEGLFGPKAGRHFGKVGIFGKVRPGFIHFREQREPFACITVFPPPLGCRLSNRTEFALDSGGGMEFYPHPRTTLRFDASDLMIHFPGQYFRFNGPWSHNFQFGTSVGFRF